VYVQHIYAIYQNSTELQYLLHNYNVQYLSNQWQYMLRSKIKNAQWVEKMTTTCSAIRETAITRTFALQLFLNNHNVLWHVKICHDAKVVTWLLKECRDHFPFTVTTRCETSFNLLKVQLASVSSVSKWLSYKFVFFTAMSVDSVKKIFTDKVELNDTSSHMSLFLNNERYNNILR